MQQWTKDLPVRIFVDDVEHILQHLTVGKVRLHLGWWKREVKTADNQMQGIFMYRFNSYRFRLYDEVYEKNSSQSRVGAMSLTSGTFSTHTNPSGEGQKVLYLLCKLNTSTPFPEDFKDKELLPKV